MSKKEEKRAILRMTILIFIIGVLGSITIGFGASLIFDFDAAPIITSGGVLTAVNCALASVYVKGAKKNEDSKNN